MKRSTRPLLEGLESRVLLSANNPWAPPAADLFVVASGHIAVNAGHQPNVPQIGAAAPASPGNLAVTPISTTQINVAWSAYSGATGFFLERSTDGVTWTTIADSVLPGDANFDGHVDLTDLNIMSSNWQKSVTPYTNGDFNGDGIVSMTDMTILAGNWQHSQNLATIPLSFQDTNLTPGTTYYYRLRAATPSGLSSYSAVISATTQSPVQNPPPNSVSITTRYGNELVIAGTSANDTISVSQSGSTLNITADGQNYTDPVPAAGLFIYGYGGSDNVTIASSVTLRTTIEMIDGTVDTINSQGTNVSAWIDSNDSYTGTGTVHRVASYYEGVSKAVGISIAEPTDSGPTVQINQSLWGTGPQITDINQGNVGDCYYLASMASMAFSNPNLLRESAVDMGDGTYTVQFTRGGTNTYVRVDNLFPAGGFGYGLEYAHPGASGANWGAVMEKAYAYFRSGANTYASLANGWMGAAYNDLGVANTSINPSVAESTFYNYVTQHLAAGKPVTLGTSNGQGAVVSSHAYSVVATSVDGSGNTYYTLRNPWGFAGGSLENSQGYVTLSYAQLQLYFPTGGVMAN